MESLTIRVKGGAAISVPASLNCITTYTLLEQEQWFEKEAGFVGRLVRPGMRAVDVGANYGVYTASLARAVGPQGHVWAFEPTQRTLDFLARTVALNGFANVSLCRTALSDHVGVGRLGLGAGGSELNSLTLIAGQPYEEVPLSTLDEQFAGQAMGAIDFLKLDAEGEELRILAGGRKVLASQSPIIMFELKAGHAVNLDIPRELRNLGYEIFRLVGPDQFLVPVGDREEFDGYELNLFAMKRARAESLATAAMLALALPTDVEIECGTGLALWQQQAFAAAAGKFRPEEGSAYARAIDAFAAWRDQARPIAERYRALLNCMSLVETATRTAPTKAAWSLLSRAAYEAGARQVAARAAVALLQLALSGEEAPMEPCWPASARYDSVVPIGGVQPWLTAAAIEAYVLYSAYSGIYCGQNWLAVLDWLGSTPYATAPMERRRQLQSLRTGRQRQIDCSPLLRAEAPEHLNAWWWGSARPEAVAAGRSV
jgi:FkbM family methyltransferase